MSSIALFYSKFTEEKEVREQLATASGYRIVQDSDLIAEVAREYGVAEDKVERTLFGPVSVFNQFTMERERITALLKIRMAEHLAEQGILFSGHIGLLIPTEVTHVLRVGIFDSKSKRIQRAMGEGLTEKSATKLVKKDDKSTAEWVEYLHGKDATDPSLYDIVVSIGSSSPETAVHLIMENYRRPAVLMNDTSQQAVADMALAARVELALVEKGYTVEVSSDYGRVTLMVHKSVHNFTALAESLTYIAAGVPGVEDVSVVTGKDYHVSIYRGQEFTLPPKVLLVDDEQEFVQTLSERLNTRNYGSYPVFDGEQALAFLGDDTPDVMVLDLKMPGLNGVEVLRRTKEFKPEIEIIILTGHGSEDDKKTCMELGAYAYLQKPVDIKELTSIIDEAHKKVAEARLVLI